MSEASQTGAAERWARGDRSAYFEQRIFLHSPFGDFPTALIVLALLIGSFLAIAWLEGVTLFARIPAGLFVAPPMRTVFALSVTLFAALYIQRYTRVRERKDYAAFAKSLKSGTIENHNIANLTPANARLGTATAIGFLGGIAASVALYFNYLSQPGLFAWFLIVTTLLGMAFTRGVELSRAGTRSAHATIAQDLHVDLLRIDLLSVWGRSAARFALIWFAVGAVSCLFFLDTGLNIFTIGLVVLFLALGVWVFLRTMQPVHAKIRKTKAEELERVRGEIDRMRLAQSAEAAARLQGLLAYEARIAAVPEWPFDQTTLYRVGASALILAVPWFGQAIAQFAIDHLAH